MVRLLVTKVNKVTQPYPTYRDFDCEKMSEVVSLSAGGSYFQYRPGTNTVIPNIYEVEQTISQIKSLCNACCSSTSA